VSDQSWRAVAWLIGLGVVALVADGALPALPSIVDRAVGQPSLFQDAGAALLLLGVVIGALLLLVGRIRSRGRTHDRVES
jgi:hypothetical protein